MNFKEFQQQYRLENLIYNCSCRLGPFEAAVGAFFLIGIPLTLILGSKEGIIAGFILGIIIYLVFRNAKKNFYKSWNEYENNNR